MARYNAPSDVGQNSQQVVDTHREAMQIIIQNVSAVTIFLGDDQGALDAVDPTTGTPDYGFVLLSGSPPLPIDRYVGKLFVRASGPGGTVECVTSRLC
jgi:hypothetical protein